MEMGKVNQSEEPLMVPAIKLSPPKKLVGKRVTMSLSADRTAELWKSFMPRRKEIKNTVGTALYSMQIYPDGLDLSSFNANALFEKWAVTEVSGFESVPDGMECLVLTEGLYAVFLHRGAADTAPATFQYIFGTWFPASVYVPDNRPHFEILGDKYINNHPDSEEEVWIPIKPKV